MKRTLALAILPLIFFSLFPLSVLAIPIHPENDIVNEIQNIITEDAANLVLSLDDFEPGWTLHKQQEKVMEGASSAYHVYYYKGTISPSVIQNTVAVYVNEDIAKEMYLKEIPTNVSLDYPDIGDECFLDISVDINKLLVFRIENVVVWIKLQQDYFKDIKGYARIVEKKINQSVAPITSPSSTQEINILPPEIVIPPAPSPNQPPEIVIPPAPETPAPITPGYIWAIVIIGLLGFIFYFIPSYIALKRHKRNKLAIILLNLLTGWTVIGWVVSLVWSVKHD